MWAAHARHGQPLLRVAARFEIAAAAPVGIGHHRLSPDLMEGDVLRGMAIAGGDCDRRKHAFGVARRPLQCLHAAHRAANHREQLVDAERRDQHRLRPDHIGNGDHRQIQAIRLPAIRIGAGRPGRAKATAQHVGTDDEETVGIDRLAGTDHQRPPAGLAGHRIGAGNMLVAGQRVANQDGVGMVGVEFAIGLVGNLPGRDRRAGVEGKRRVRAETHDEARRIVGLAAAQARLRIGLGKGRVQHCRFNIRPLPNGTRHARRHEGG